MKRKVTNQQGNCNGKANYNSKAQKGKNSKSVREQPKKDSDDKRINLDNARVTKVERDMNKASANDITWYSRSQELMKSAATLPFSTILGLTDTFRVPGVMRIGWSPAFGSDDIALNQAFNSMYSFLVHANSRNYSYNAPDLGMLTMAGAQVFCILGAMIRAYGTAKAYTEENAYYPDALLTAQGFNPSDLRKNLGQAWFDINNLIDQSKQIWIPNTMPIMDRWLWLNSNMFTDAEGFRSQTYIYVQDVFFMYDETSSSTGGMLVPAIETDATIGANPGGTVAAWFNPALRQYLWSDWVAVAQKMIDRLINSEDRGIIYGDILNAYGTDKIRAFSPIEANFTIVPVYNAEALMQLENTIVTPCAIRGLVQNPNTNRLCSAFADKFVFNITDVTEDPHWSATQTRVAQSNIVLNYHGPGQPAPEVVTVMTRNLCVGAQEISRYTLSPNETNTKWNVSSKGTVCPIANGSELFHSISIIYRNDGSQSATVEWLFADVLQLHSQVKSLSASPNTAFSMLPWLCLLSQFDWHPLIYFGADWAEISGSAVVTVTPTVLQNITGDLDNYSLVYVDNIKKLHNMAIFSELGVPQI